jgi:hypothetical protein
VIVPVVKRSRLGFAAAATFLSLFVGVSCWVFFIASKNPADSGESGILLLPFTMPWITILPSAWVGLPVALGCVLLNTVSVYLLFGGLRLRRL